MLKIKELRKSKGISQGKLASILNVSRSAVSMWEIGKSNPDNDVLFKISEYFGVSIDYILGKELGEIKSPGHSQHSFRIPVIGCSAAGIPLETIMEYIDDNDPDTWEEITQSMAASGQYVAVRIKGDSMEPRIMDGDIVIVRIQSDIDTGDTAIVFVNGNEATCKKIKKRPEGVMLISNNSKYDPMFFSNEEIASVPVRFYGKVIEVRGKL